MREPINVFLPMRFGSERVINKNTRTFSGIEGGLCRIKLEQLLQSNTIDRIFVSTDDVVVSKICDSFQSQKIKVIPRIPELCSSDTSTDDLIKYAASIMPEGHIIWTHVTSPFINGSHYDRMIEVYLDNLNDYDSLMTVTKLQKFIWNNKAPINYDDTLEKWPRTQTIDPLWEVNSGAFIATKSIYRQRLNRIGEAPYFYELEGEASLDIDWMIDFEIAEILYRQTRFHEKI